MPDVIDALSKSVSELLHCIRYALKLLAEDDPPQIKCFTACFSRGKQIVRPLVVLPAMRPDDPAQVM